MPELPEETDSLLTKGQVAALLKVHPDTISTWARRGLLNPVKLPTGHYRFRRTEVLDILEGRKPGAQKHASGRITY